ncbi:protein phosphatase inhibitor 2-like [Hetaerina americana]|uniref:protein phosphatase inhibitor 2-like n=1 Tax=Hetaerina americana TaxID=62018 RepID=UPI003A7F40C9
MAENLGKRPSKGILKTSSSFEKSDVPKSKYKETKWDEINILATLHPADKDYGHTKIDEPKTPYNYWEDGESHSGDEADGLDADVLAERIQRGANMPPKIMMQEEIDEEEEEEEEELDEEERAKRILFDIKRKAHYNEFHAIKLARKLMERDESEEDEDSDANQEQGAGVEEHNKNDKPSSSSTTN